MSPPADYGVLYVLYLMCTTLSEFLSFVIPSAPSAHLVGGWDADENSPALCICQNGAFKSSPLYKEGDFWCFVLLQASHQHCSSEKSFKILLGICQAFHSCIWVESFLRL